MPHLTSPALPLSSSPTLDLWRAYREERTAARRNALAVAYLPLVNRLASGMAARLPANVEADDLAAAGAIGLVRAIERFDPTRGPFEPYGSARIRGAMLDELRRMDWAPRSLRRGNATVRQMTTLPLDELDTADPRAANPATTAERVDLVAAALIGLTDRHRAVLVGRFIDGRKLREIAVAIERTSSRTSQILREGLRHARRNLEGDER